MTRAGGCSAGSPHPALEEFVVGGVAAGWWPGAVYAVGPPEERPQWSGAAGRLAIAPAAEPARLDGLYDLASLTKGLATAAILLRLADRGVVDLDAPLDAELPEMSGYAGRTPSFADLLLHRAGLAAWAPIYGRGAAPEHAVELIAALPPEARAGERVIYSCLGPIAAGVALERRTGCGLRDLFMAHVLAPLDVACEDLDFGPLSERLVHRTAPTEAGRAYEATLAGGAAAAGSERCEPLRGVVHDGNACFLGGAAGNAGLFGAAHAVFRVGSALAAPGAFLSDALWSRSATAGASDGRDARTFGFQAGAAPGAPAGALGRDSFGHVGFTGVSVWIAPRRPLIAVLLTNRVHPRWTLAPMQTWRREFHGLAARTCCEGAP